MVHEEGRQDGSVFPDDFLTKTSVTLGQLLVREVLWPLEVARNKPEVIPILKFDQTAGTNVYQRLPDFKLVIKVNERHFIGWDLLNFFC